MIKTLFRFANILGQWRQRVHDPDCKHRGLELEVGLWSPSDNQHTFSRAQPIDPFSDDLNALFKAQQNDPQSLTSTLHCMRDGKRFGIPTQSAVRLVLGKQPIDLDFSRTWRLPERFRTILVMDIVTTFRVRPRFYRMLAPGALEELLPKFPRLVSLEIEQWRTVDRGHVRNIERSYKSILRNGLPKH